MLLRQVLPTPPTVYTIQYSAAPRDLSSFQTHVRPPGAQEPWLLVQDREQDTDLSLAWELLKPQLQRGPCKLLLVLWQMTGFHW